MLTNLFVIGKHGLGGLLALGALACVLCLPCGQLQAAEAAETTVAEAAGEESMQGVRQLDSVVVSASGVEQKIVDAPASISVITQEELQRKPFINLLDALRTVEGVDVGETTDKTGQGTISIRGMGADYTLILIDGKRQNNNGDLYPNNFGGNQFNHLPSLDAIERIEVIRGPMSTLYGADAMGGVINIITKKNTKEWHGSLSVGRTIQEESDFGDDYTTNVNLMGPLFKDKLSMALRGSFYHRDPSNPTYGVAVDPNGVRHEPDSSGFGGGGRTVENDIWTLGGRLSFTPTENHDIIFDYDTSRQKYDNSENQVGTLDSLTSILRMGSNNATTGIDTRGTVQPRVGYAADQRFERDQWSLQHNGRWGMGNTTVSVSYVDTANKGRSMPFTVDERSSLQSIWNAAWARQGVATTDTYGNLRPGGLFNNNWTEDQKLAALNLTAAELAELESFLPRKMRTLETKQYTWDAKYDVQLGSHLLVVGAQVIDGEMEDSVFGMTGTSGAKSGEVQEHNMWALFAEDSWNLFKGFTLTGGVRYDHHNEFGGQASPRIYSVWNFLPDWTLKGGISTGYKTPKTSQLFDGIVGFGGQGTSPMVGNPDLEPEESLNYEAAIYFEHPDGHGLNITGFYNRFKNKISSRSGQAIDIGTGWALLGYTSFSQPYNVGRADVKGVEVAGRLSLPFNIGLKANYTFTDSEQKSGTDKGNPLTNNAKHMFNATLSWAPLEALQLYFESELRSKRYRGTTEANGSYYYKSYDIYHLGASYTFSENFIMHFRVNNLFDKDFTTYSPIFTPDGSGGWDLDDNVDDYNVKAARRSFWVGFNCNF